MPPAWMMRLLIRVAPSLRRSEKALKRTLRERPWIAGTERWYQVDRPAAISRNTALTRVNPAELDNSALANHVAECFEEFLRSARQHMQLHAHDALPPALFGVWMVERGFTPAEALELFAGASPASTGESDELAALRAAVAGRPATTIEELRGLGPNVSDALDAFIERHGWRLVDGYDIDSPSLVEIPSLLLARALSPAPRDRSAEQAQRVAAARERLAASDRSEFDRMLSQGRAAYGLRDENGGILVAWVCGLLRRAMLEAGVRHVRRGEFDTPALALEAEPRALAASLRGESTLSADALRKHAAARRALRASDAPRSFGPPEAPPPSNMPGALGLAMRAFSIFGLQHGQSAHPLHGTGIGSEPYEGRARLLTGAGEGFDLFEPGDVLVAPMTSPSCNVVLAMAGGLVTEEGDTMSHAAIMARELGLPAVIGAREATRQIRDGDRVLVDPAAGRVTVLEPAPSLATVDGR